MQKHLIALFTVLFLSGCKGSSYTAECKQAHEKLLKCMEKNLDVNSLESSVEICRVDYLIYLVASLKSFQMSKERRE